MEQAIPNQIDILKNTIVRTVPVEKIYLFGSYAYDAPLPALEAEQKISLARFRSGLRTLPADIFVLSKARFERRLTAPTLEQEVSKKGIVIYG